VDFLSANLSGANLQTAILVNAGLEGAGLTGCRLYSASAWGVKLNRTKQQNLINTRESARDITETVSRWSDCGRRCRDHVGDTQCVGVVASSEHLHNSDQVIEWFGPLRSCVVEA
jgi:Pentapeptide repeats (8 copies)